MEGVEVPFASKKLSYWPIVGLFMMATTHREMSSALAKQQASTILSGCQVCRPCTVSINGRKTQECYLWSASKQGQSSSKDCWPVKAGSAHWGLQGGATPVL